MQQYYHTSDKSVRVYKWGVGDTFTEVAHSPLLGHTYAINSITFSPFGTKLASAGTDGVTIIWDVKVTNYWVTNYWVTNCWVTNYWVTSCWVTNYWVTSCWVISCWVTNYWV